MATQVKTAQIADTTVTAAKISHEAWTSWVPTISVSGGTAPSYSTMVECYYQRINNTVFARMILSNLSGGTAGSGTNGIRFTLPVNGVDTNIPAGFATIYEESGTITSAIVEISEDASKGLFRNYTAAEISGNDQSSTVRVIRAFLVYEAA